MTQPARVVTMEVVHLPATRVHYPLGIYSTYNSHFLLPTLLFITDQKRPSNMYKFKENEGVNKNTQAHIWWNSTKHRLFNILHWHQPIRHVMCNRLIGKDLEATFIIIPHPFTLFIGIPAHHEPAQTSQFRKGKYFVNCIFAFQKPCIILHTMWDFYGLFMV